ncbi:MAG: hypothetical protein GEU78_20330, partial [Actinobacteria bacterium]|nr:hypothetical protein [Actinomycetota bacterium]
MRTDVFVIGYHAATAGRLVRFVVGVLGVYVSVWWMTQQPGDIGTAALAVAVAAGFYATTSGFTALSTTSRPSNMRP